MSGIINSINAFISYFWKLYTAVIWFFNLIWSFFTSIFSILQSLWYGATTLFSWIWEVVNQVFDSPVFDYIWTIWNYLVNFLWYPTVLFLCTMFIIILVRIWIAFVFKVLRLNVDYHNTYQKNRTLWQHSKLK